MVTSSGRGRGRRRGAWGGTILLGIALGWLIAYGAASFGGTEGAGNALPEPLPPLNATSLVVLDVDTGELLISVRGHEPSAPGPLAQLATVWAAWYERIHVAGGTPDEAVLVSERAAHRLGLRLGWRYGESGTLLDMVTAVLYWGAADAVHALTEHVWGSEAAFARQVHHQLEPFGVRQTRLASPQGSDRPSQFMTAYDVALVARHILLDPVLGPLAGQRRGSVVVGGERRAVMQLNSFLLRYPGASGLKSGYSEAAGYVGAASARRNGRHLVAVIFGAPSAEERYAQLEQFLDYAFRHANALRERPRVDALPYDVEPGDTLSKIAERFGLDAARIQEFNRLPHPEALEAGSRLWLPVAP